ncbi:MAG: phospho-N-acetylmuramoyl-pentapeptide-transferase [Candidatus Brocadiia bacterium]|jgi:phospho-N-acetylmuramoyl-pentapeptide-transferase|nr:phospho-N-acetylmuramoyl-pentapeptide-transferase [Candidatus Brocadiia bacterium]
MLQFLTSATFEGPYLHLRVLGAFLTALLIAALGGRAVIAWLRRRKLGERTDKTPIEDEGLREEIMKKAGTPTMGGLILLGALVPAALLWGDTRSAPLWLALGCFVALAGLGMADDWLKLTGEAHRDRGLLLRHKLLVQGLLGCVLGAVWLRMGGARIHVPGLHGWGITVGILMVPWVALIVATMSNAVNVTDGLDGLAGGLGLVALLPLGLFALGPWGGAEGARLSGPDVTEVSIFCAALGGAMLGFLWHNAHPARVFMGDTGSLALGGSLGLVAVMVRAELWLPLIAFAFLAEFASSVLQVLWFKATGRRILPIAPLHHIWQRRGTPEARLVARFWIVGLALALIPLLLR